MDRSPQQAVLALATCFTPEDEARHYPQACWERLQTDLHAIIEAGETETWASFADLLVDFPGRVASVYQFAHPPHYFPEVSRLLLDAQWLGTLSEAALHRAKGLVCRLLRLGKEGALAAELAQQEPTTTLQNFFLQLSPVERLVLALVKVSPEAFVRLVPQATSAIVQSLETFVPLRVRITTLQAADSLCTLISRYGSALPYVAREWSHPEFARRLDESSNRNLTLQLYACRERLGDLLSVLSEGIQARLACPTPEFHKSGLLIAAQLYTASALDASDRIECSLDQYLSSEAAPEGDSDDESDYESEGEATRYLSDLVDALDCENKERVSRAICSAASLISEDLDELDVETPRLAESLLKTENTFGLPEFEGARLKALCALTTLRPLTMLPILGRRMQDEGSRCKLLALSVIDKAAEGLSETAGPRVASKRADSAKTRYFHTSKAPASSTTQFAQHHSAFLQAVLDLYRKPMMDDVFAAGAVTLSKLFALAGHLRSQELTRALVYAVRDCVRPGLQRSREVVTASLMLLDNVLRQFAAATHWQEVLTSTLQDYVALRDDLADILHTLEQLKLHGLETVVAEIAAKVRVIMLDDLQ